MATININTLNASAIDLEQQDFRKQAALMNLSFSSFLECIQTLFNTLQLYHYTCITVMFRTLGILISSSFKMARLSGFPGWYMISTLIRQVKHA